MLRKTNNQLNQKLVNIMTYIKYIHTDTDTGTDAHTRARTHAHTHTHTHMYTYHCFISLSRPTSVSVLTSKVR